MGLLPTAIMVKSIIILGHRFSISMVLQLTTAEQLPTIVVLQLPTIKQLATVEQLPTVEQLMGAVRLTPRVPLMTPEYATSVHKNSSLQKISNLIITKSE
mgnify:CR=1 FL=1